MATIKQIEANRRNSLLSTGPKTTEGKAAACLNALRHGLRARATILPGENREDLEQLLEALEQTWLPQNPTEQYYIEQMAVNQWKLIRLKHDYSAKDQIPLLDRVWQQQARLERSYDRAQRSLRRVQEERRLDAARQPEMPAPAPPPVEEIPAPAAEAPPASPPPRASNLVCISPRPAPPSAEVGRDRLNTSDAVASP
jgi:hypothetical protein